MEDAEAAATAAAAAAFLAAAALTPPGVRWLKGMSYWCSLPVGLTAPPFMVADLLLETEGESCRHGI